MSEMLEVAGERVLRRAALFLRGSPSWQNQVCICQPMVSIPVRAAFRCGVAITLPLENDGTQFTGRNGNRAEPVEIWKARRLIRDHSDEELSLTQIARSVNLSANYLSEKFKEVTGFNFVRYVGHTRIARARDLLRGSDLRISEIAFATGFQSLSQFNRTFRKLCGQSPTAFRGTGSRQIRRG
jgi:AraC-like DNA-binding protein